LRKQAQAYGVEMIGARITELRRDGEGFTATSGRELIKAQFVLLATGIVDESPDVPGLDEAVAKGSIRYCPVCDGYEAADHRIGILGHGEGASSKARLPSQPPLDHRRDVFQLDWPQRLALSDAVPFRQTAPAARRRGVLRDE